MPVQRNGATVPEAVREILTRNYPIYQCLKLKLMNFHSLAELIQPQVKRLSGRDASINTLVVAIKRFSDTLPSDKSPNASKVLMDARISLSSGIADVTIRAPKTQFSTIIKELSEVWSDLSEFPHIFPLSGSIKIILPGEDYRLVREKLEHFRDATTQSNMAKLTLNLSPRAEMTPGIAAFVTELLFRNGVNILDAFLGYGDIIMVVDEKDGPLAYDVLQGEIHGSTNGKTGSNEPER